MSTGISLATILENWAGADAPRIALAEILKTITRTSAELSKSIARHELAAVDSAGERNTDGDPVEPLDSFAHQLYVDALCHSPIGFIASEEAETPIVIDRGARYGVAIDPVDGSSNIETNLSIGAIFSVLEAGVDELTDICPGERQRAAGFVCFGPQTRLVLTWGEGSQVFLLDPANGEFRTIGEPLQIPNGKCEFAINVSNYRFWEPSVRHFIDDCIAGESGNLGHDFNMRWNASLVAEAYRILMRGGVFLYPGDSRPGYADGRLRLLYEAVPMAMIVEQAGGSASDGRERILDLRLESLHRRVPLVFGSRDRVAEVFDYVSGTAFQATRFPLFEQRGLLRN
ncbi:MAG TPA: class 1 fructose-bisphosphatase [Gammaproteobacteria bacterium]|jgi:fructose-1,6-bisphosphatase I